MTKCYSVRRNQYRQVLSGYDERILLANLLLVITGWSREHSLGSSGFQEVVRKMTFASLGRMGPCYELHSLKISRREEALLSHVLSCFRQSNGPFYQCVGL